MEKKRPITPGQRQMTREDFSLLTKAKPEKGLRIRLSYHAGRSKGRITVRHKGGGAKRLYRTIDFKQEKLRIPAKVLSIEYDPYRTAFVSLVQYQDGEKRYILAPQGLKPGDEVIADEKTEVRPGNRMKLKHIPVGTVVHNVELVPGGGGKLIRAAGAGAQVLAYEGVYVHLAMPSKEIRKIHGDCFASIGSLSRPGHRFVVLGKAGKTRWRRIRPTVRGSAMNPVDHPHGGGEGRAPIGLRHPKTPWGKPALGVKTRKPSKPSEKFIIQRRK